METTGLLDDRNSDLWNELNLVHEIIIQESKFPYYSSFSKNKTTIIYVPPADISPASFTHELLHIYLRTKEIFIGGGLMRSLKNSEKLSNIFSTELIEHIGNCLDHIKMFPEFLRLGYNESTFLSDYYANKLTFDEITKIKGNYKKNNLFNEVYNSSEIDYFVGKYFAANSCPNKTYNYDRQLNELEKIDPDLFQILETFLTDWKHFDYNDQYPILGNYHSFLFDFIENLEKWTDGKAIQ